VIVAGLGKAVLSEIWDVGGKTEKREGGRGGQSYTTKTRYSMKTRQWTKKVKFSPIIVKKTRQNNACGMLGMLAARLACM